MKLTSSRGGQVGHEEITCPPPPQYRHNPIVSSAAQWVPTALPQFAWVLILVLEGKGSLGDGMRECNGSKRFVRRSMIACVRSNE